MMCVFNFSVGFVILLELVLCQVQVEMLEWNGVGVFIVEMSYCGLEFMVVVVQVDVDLCCLIGIFDDYVVLFLVGGVIIQQVLFVFNFVGFG